ncbi:SRPBCC family protein [Streptomyces sp. NPDC017179]|uniref:SRPBCC family protein n=1 Tax=Streptomyces sp. NPDC017179 TaxID=3364979 RepID=UPI0037A4BAD9
MTEALGSATRAAGGAAKGSPLGDLAHSEAADRLKAEVQDYLAAQAQRLLAGAGRKLGETTGKLTDIAEGKSPGFGKLALDAGRKLAQGKGPLRTALEVGGSRVKENVMGGLQSLAGGGKGKRKKRAGQKPTVIMESIDVGVPLRTAYDQWTQYQDFSTFAKGVKSADRADDAHSDWQVKVWWSKRSWKAQTIEQVPDYHIQWTSEGGKGTTKGVVSFHRLEDNLTRVLLVMEYYPSGFFEKTGNIWRAQGRRARLDLKNFARFITLKGEAEDSWRGEIRDGEVVRSHEDAIAEEEQEAAEGAEEEPEEENGYEDEDQGEEQPYEEDEEEGPYAEEENGEDESADEADEAEPEGEEENGEYEDESAYEGAEADEAEPEDEDEEESESESEYAEGGGRR